jgi:serine/threonine protein kinase
MGIVFLAKDQLLFRDLALKKLTSGLNQDQNVIIRFQQEARALAQLSHPNIVQIYDFVQEENQSWIAMEYVEGSDLGSLIERRGKYPIDDALRICIPIVEAMDYAHNRGVVHRDFKPSNVLIATDGVPKVMDFGLAKLSHSSIVTMEGSLLGSPAFMSPEQARSETVETRSDIYAMGVTLYQLVTGKLPFEGELKRVLTQKIAGCQPSMDPLENQMPAALVHLIKQMLATDPDDRPATMKAISQALKSIINSIA